MTVNDSSKSSSKSKSDSFDIEEGNFSECMLARVIAKLAVKAQCEDKQCDHTQCGQSEKSAPSEAKAKAKTKPKQSKRSR